MTKHIEQMIRPNFITRIDAAIYAFGMRPVYFYEGCLYQRMEAGHGVELRSHFPGWVFRTYSRAKNWLPNLHATIAKAAGHE